MIVPSLRWHDFFDYKRYGSAEKHGIDGKKHYLCMETSNQKHE